jgi:DNA-binding NarL/FixJ family response regulator
MKSGVAGTSTAGVNANTADTQPTTRALLRTVLTEPYHVSVAAVPLDQAEAWLENCAESCDLAVLMFQCANMQSLRTAIGLDARLPSHVPRLFLASKSDTIPSAQVLSLGVHSPSVSGRGEFGNTTRTTREALKSAHEAVLQEASLHLQARGLPPLALVSTLSGEGVTEAQNLILDVATDPERGLPKDKPKAAQSFALTLTSVASAAAIFTVVGSLTVGLLWHFNPRVKEVLNEWWASLRKFIRQQQQQLAIAN